MRALLCGSEMGQDVAGAITAGTIHQTCRCTFTMLLRSLTPTCAQMRRTWFCYAKSVIGLSTQGGM